MPRSNDAPKMRPLARSGLTWLTVFLVVTIFFVLRWLTAAGVFSSVPANTLGICKAIPGLAGPEDFEVDAVHDAIIVSSTNRRVAKGASDPHDGLYLLKLGTPQAPAERKIATPVDSELTRLLIATIASITNADMPHTAAAETPILESFLCTKSLSR